MAAWQAGEYCAIIGAGPIGLVAGMVAQAYGAHAILLDLVQERLDFAKSLGIEYVINSGKEDPVERIKEITGGEMAHQVMECSGANPAIRQTFDLVSNAGRITLTGWPKKETSCPPMSSPRRKSTSAVPAPVLANLRRLWTSSTAARSI